MLTNNMLFYLLLFSSFGLLWSNQCIMEQQQNITTPLFYKKVITNKTIFFLLSLLDTVKTKDIAMSNSRNNLKNIAYNNVYLDNK